MKCFFVLCFDIVVSILFLDKCDAKFYQVNETDLSTCKVQYTRSEGAYKIFHTISENAHDNGSILDFHFAVLASSDAHILLSPASDVQKTDPAYEIVLGAGGNTFCDIRRKQKSAVKASLRIKGVLSALDVKYFWIHVSKDGIIGVGRAGEELAFLEWRDTDPLPLKYFSFCTWPGVEAKWYYDCVYTDRKTNSTSTTDSQEVVRPMSDLERLRRDLLFFYDPFSRPVYNVEDFLEIQMRFLSNNIVLDETKSLLSISGSMELSWYDEKLRWNSSDYGGVGEIHIFYREIWLPELVLLNAADTGTDLLKPTMIIVKENGLVLWRPIFSMNSWCNVPQDGLWPNDIHSCDLFLGLWSYQSNTVMIFNSSSMFIEQHNKEWLVQSVSGRSSNKGSSIASKYIRNYDLETITQDHPVLEISFVVQRSSDGYYVILFAPFVLISTLMLSVFCVSPLGNQKIALGCLQLVITSLTLAVVGVIMPVHPNTVPAIVIVYDACLVLGVVSMYWSTIFINLARNVHYSGLPHFVTMVLTSPVTGKVLLLPNTKLTKNYGELCISQSEKSGDNQDIWILLGIVVDRIFFFVYAIFILYFAFY